MIFLLMNLSKSMFEEAFTDEIIKLGNDTRFAQQLWKEIESKYQAAGRVYHTIPHLKHIYLELLPVKNEISDWQTVIFSIAFHDVIYNPLSKDNEKQSAGYAGIKLKEAHASISQIKKCKKQILATITHELSADADTNYFTDADLAILGAAPEVYLSYTADIRKEYGHYPDAAYNEGRKKVIMHFLRMQKIFKTTYFHHYYESQAKNNLVSELARLGNT